MVSVPSLDKVSPIDTYSESWQVPQPFPSKDQKIAADERGRNNKLFGPLPRIVDPNGKSCADSNLEQKAYNMDRCLASAKGANNETSLFSSSLSDIFSHKLRMSASKSPFHQSASNANSQTGNMGSLKRVEETESQAINNLLPDEDDLLSGVIGFGNVADSNNEDDLDDFDLFSCTGGIELEADENIWAGNRNLDFNKGISYSQWAATVGNGNHHAIHLHNAARLLNGGAVERGSPHKSSGVENSFHSPSFPASVGNQFSLGQPSYSPGHMNLDNQYFQDFHSHSLPDVHNRVVNAVPWKNPLDNITDGFSGSPRITGEISRDLRQVDLSGKAASLNGRAYGYSGNGSLPVQMGWSLSGKPDLYEQHPSRSAVWPNSPSFPNVENAHYAVQPPGFRKLPHAMMNAASPLHLQVGSAPVNAAFWDPLETYGDLSMQSKSNQSLAMHCGSPSHPTDISSQHSFPRAGGTCVDLSKHAGLLSQMSPHAFNGRNPSISMQSSFAFPGERIRNRANSSNIDKKNYELNIDRILRGEDRRTTLMIKNIPNKYTSKMLLATIDELHKGTYDFIYLPIDFKNKCNVGYAFINMVDPKHIVSFYQTFNGKRWEKFNSEKVASLAYARIQGKSALVAHFQNSSLMNEDKRCRPILFHTEGPNAGDQEPFPTSGNFRLRGSRAHTNFEQDMEGRIQMKE